MENQVSAPKSFKMAAKAGLSAHDEEYPPRDYRFVSATEFDPPKEEGKKPKAKETVVTAHYPGDGNMTLFLAALGADDAEIDTLASVFSILENSLTPEHYKFLRQRLRAEEIDSNTLVAMVEDMMEAWLLFPTQPSSDSPKSRGTTGTRSTGRAPGTGSTQQGSLPAAS